MSEERGFEVVDKRRVRVETPEASETPDSAAGTEGEAPQAAGGEDAAFDARDEEPLAEEEMPGGAEGAGAAGGFPQVDVSVAGIIGMTVGLLNERAWVGMGLVPDPMSGRIQRNLSEARRAIDVIADLVKHLETDASPEEKRELQTLLSNLQLNFVRQAGNPG